MSVWTQFSMTGRAAVTPAPMAADSALLPMLRKRGRNVDRRGGRTTMAPGGVRNGLEAIDPVALLGPRVAGAGLRLPAGGSMMAAPVPGSLLCLGGIYATSHDCRTG